MQDDVGTHCTAQAQQTVGGVSQSLWMHARGTMKSRRCITEERGETTPLGRNPEGDLGGGGSGYRQTQEVARCHILRPHTTQIQTWALLLHGSPKSATPRSGFCTACPQNPQAILPGPVASRPPETLKPCFSVVETREVCSFTGRLRGSNVGIG